MKINKIKIVDLYGYLNKDIDFKDDITLLVGINGSGKTSILNIISWIIKPSLNHLCITQFKKIILIFTFNGAEYTVECKHLKSALTYNLMSSNPKEIFHPLTIKLDNNPSELAYDEDLKKDALSKYYDLRPNKKEEKTWDFINDLPDPVTIGLDRDLYNEENIYRAEIHKGRVVRKEKRSKISPIDKVRIIINTEYRKSKNAILELTAQLKNQLVLSAFDGSISFDSVSSGIKLKLTLKQIETVEKKFNDYFMKFEESTFTKNDQKLISNYFYQLKKITKEYLKNKNDVSAEILFGLNASQFDKLRKLLKEFNKFESKSEKILEKINLYVDTLNHLFKDSNKILLFKEDTAELTYNVVDKKEKITNYYKDINHLSSGEQQILILFSYVAFSSKEGQLFIIDEPELSLHIKWQEEFLSSLEKIAHKSNQLIFATHSPILVGEKKDKAVLLLPYNS